MSSWDFFWFILVSYALIAYLMVLFSIVTDLFRDQETSGWSKAAWFIALIFLPFLAAFVYVIARGRGMTERAAGHAVAMKQQQDAYIRDVAGTASPVDQIAQAKALYDDGVISEAEYTRLKEKALV